MFYFLLLGITLTNTMQINKRETCFFTEVYYVRQQNNMTLGKKKPRYLGSEMIEFIGTPAIHSSQQIK